MSLATSSPAHSQSSDSEDLTDFALYNTNDWHRDWDTYSDAYEDLPIRRAVERSLAAGPDNQASNPERPSSASPHFNQLLTVS
jgi:hypothetical protein